MSVQPTSHPSVPPSHPPSSHPSLPRLLVAQRVLGQGHQRLSVGLLDARSLHHELGNVLAHFLAHAVLLDQHVEARALPLVALCDGGMMTVVVVVVVMVVAMAMMMV